MTFPSSHWRNSSKVFHERADEYDSWFEESLLFAIESGAIASLDFDTTQPALEIGVGPGRFAEKFGSGFGIDPANRPLHLATSRHIKVCQAVGEALPFIDCCFTRVSIFFTLCFVQDPGKVLREAYRVLQESGLLILGFVPSSSSWGKTLREKKKHGHPFYEHAHFFSIEECEQLLLKNGFTIRASRSSLFQKPGEVTAMETARSGMEKEAGFIALALQK